MARAQAGEKPALGGLRRPRRGGSGSAPLGFEAMNARVCIHAFTNPFIGSPLQLCGCIRMYSCGPAFTHPFPHLFIQQIQSLQRTIFTQAPMFTRFLLGTWPCAGCWEFTGEPDGWVPVFLELGIWHENHPSIMRRIQR